MNKLKKFKEKTFEDIKHIDEKRKWILGSKGITTNFRI